MICDNAREIISGYVDSTKRWLYHYIIEQIDDSFLRSRIESAVKEIYDFQNAILEQLDREDKEDDDVTYSKEEVRDLGAFIKSPDGLKSWQERGIYVEVRNVGE